MRTSDQLDHLITALAAASLEIKPIPMNGENSFFKKAGTNKPTKYATLSDIKTAINTPLSTHGLAIVQGCEFREARVVVTTRLMHKSGQWIESELSLRPAADDSQKVGSCITYARRYGISSILNLVADEDDDGEAAVGRGSVREEKKPLVVPQAPPAFMKNKETDVAKLRTALTMTHPHLDESLFHLIVETVDGKSLTKGKVDAIAAILETPEFSIERVLEIVG